MSSQFRNALFVFFSVLLIGTTGYKGILQEQISWFDSLYMTVITITTVGFTEVVDLSGNALARSFTMVVLLIGMANLLYIVSLITSSLVDIGANQKRRRLRMLKKIQEFSQHTIICGGGRVGFHLLEEVFLGDQQSVAQVVIIEKDAERVETLASDFPKAHVICGDATDDDLLVDLGISRASTLVAGLPSDKDNLFVVMAGRQLNNSLKIIARYNYAANETKLNRAGANQLFSPAFLGGHRLASLILRPTITDFIDDLMSSNSTVQLKEIGVPETSSLIGQSLTDLNASHAMGVQIIGVRESNAINYVYSPSGAYEIKGDSELVALGTQEDLLKFADLVER